MKIEEFKNRIAVLGVIAIFSILTLLLDSVGFLTKMYDFTAFITAPIRLQFHQLSVDINDIIGSVSQITSFKEDNENLRQEVADLLERLSEFEEYKAENESLKRQLKLREDEREWILQGRVISADIAYGNTIQINVGSRDEVEEGDIVVSGEYAVGKVKKVNEYTSLISLINSGENNIPVKGQVNRARGITQANVGPTIDMIDILPDEVIEEDEVIVTSGLESNFPADLIIGVVTKVNDNPANTTQVAEVKVQVDFSKLDYIYVIKGQR